jgi:hypothetical protein
MEAIVETTGAPCALCGSLGVTWGKLCDACKGFDYPDSSKEVRMIQSKKLKQCKKCGRTEEETKFFPSISHQCVECQYARQKASRDKKRKLYTPEPPPAVNPVPSDFESAQEQALREIDSVPEVMICPDTQTEIKLRSWTEDLQPPKINIVTMDFSPYPWALDWLKGHMNGNPDVGAALVRECAERVPPEWLKAHLMGAKDER